MRVLIACEFSGRVRDAFTAKGHYAMSCDLLPSESPGPHYEGSIFDVLDDGWDMMIAHPPCTYLSNAGARHLYPKGVLNEDRYKKGLEAKYFFMALLNANIGKICIENPVPSTIYGLPKCSQMIQPYFFGDPYMKRTCLWLKNLTELEPTYMLDPSECLSTKVPGNWFNAGGKDRQKNRSRTFPGIAEAMADQWGGCMTKSEQLIHDIRCMMAYESSLPMPLYIKICELLEEYREVVSTNLRMEQTIHNMRKL
jgi:hypothetical protein